MPVTGKTKRKGASRRPAGRRAASQDAAATPPPSARASQPIGLEPPATEGARTVGPEGTLSSVTLAAAPAPPPSLELAVRLRAGDDTALTTIKETSLRALYEHGLLEHFHLLDDVLNDRITEEVVVPGVGVVHRNPTIDQKLKAYQLMLGAATKRQQGGPSGLPSLGDGVKWGVIFLPVPDPVLDESFVEVAHTNGNGHRAA